MADLSAWIASWQKLRAEFESLSIDNPGVRLCLWHDRDYQCGNTYTLERLWTALGLEQQLPDGSGKRNAKTSTADRQFAMGILSADSYGSFALWLMHERLADATLSVSLDDPAVDSEVHRAKRVEQAFENLMEHASDLLRSIPNDAGIKLVDDANLPNNRYWLMAMILFHGVNESPALRHRTQDFLPEFVPLSCKTAETMALHRGLTVLSRNPFCEAVAAIDELTSPSATSHEAPNGSQSEQVGRKWTMLYELLKPQTLPTAKESRLPIRDEYNRRFANKSNGKGGKWPHADDDNVKEAVKYLQKLDRQKTGKYS